jgi:HAD superfamily hydrolase (TIGR01549 family)
MVKFSVESIRGVIFDFDGTLYNSKHFPLHLICAGPADIFLVRAERLVRARFVGSDYGSAEAYYREFFTELSRPARRPPAFVKSWYLEKYIPRMTQILKKYYRCRPGTPELFKALRTAGNVAGKPIPFTVYSDYPYTSGRLAAIGIDASLPNVIYGPEDFGAQKPAPRPFLTIAAALGCAPAEILVVGDRDETDGAGAAAAGMGFVKIGDDGDWTEFCETIGAGFKSN